MGLDEFYQEISSWRKVVIRQEQYPVGHIGVTDIVLYCADEGTDRLDR